MSVDAEILFGKISFREGLLFTHRGLSGPSVLQISSYRDQGAKITINLLPDLDLFSLIKQNKSEFPKKTLKTILYYDLPNRLVDDILSELDLNGKIADLSHEKLRFLSKRVQKLDVIPKGTEGYRTAEVTYGGANVNDISVQTIKAKSQQGLYFIGKVIDVTGHLGGYNFQWAWSSGFVAGQDV